MRIDSLCRRYGLPKQIAEALAKSGMRRLYPPQVEAIKKGVLDGKSLVLALPTAAGKTLIAELSMFCSIFLSNGRCLYVVPLRAIAAEKYKEFKERYEPLGIKVGIATGDYDTANPRLAEFQILIVTSEKADSLLRHRVGWFGEGLSVVVLDEIHLINDPIRGPTLEMLAARLRQINPQLQILALSATIKNSDEIADWLNAELVTSQWRPVPLKEGVFCQRQIRFADGTRELISSDIADNLSIIALSTIYRKGQVLIFVNTRRSAQATAGTVGRYVQKLLTSEEKEQLGQLAKIIEAAVGEPTKICRRLSQYVRQGTAFHHAGLHPKQRKAIEEGFRQNLIKVISATPTLAAGVDLPSRRTIIRDWRRYEPAVGLRRIPVLEYKQMCGRAGRPKYDKFGEAVLVARTKAEAEMLFEEFIWAEPEPISSKLASEQALRTHVLASIAANYASDLQGILKFLSGTFFAYQYEAQDVSFIIRPILDFLEQEDMIRRRKSGFIATAFGHLVSRLYIDPITGVILRDGLKERSFRRPVELGLLHLICKTPDMGLLPLRPRDYVDIESFVAQHASELLLKEKDRVDEQFLATVKTAWMLVDWMGEIKEETIHERFGIGPGDIRRHIETAKWLIYSSYQLAKLFKASHLLPILAKLRQRLHYGIKEELLELVKLRGIGRLRARSLYNTGYQKLADIKHASSKELSEVPLIGIEIAKNIKEQLYNK